MTHKRIILVGKAASGKDHARKKLQERRFKYAVAFTTRPPRNGEVDGKDYNFISRREFERMIGTDEFYEWAPFNDWYYGTGRKQFFEDDVFIMTPKGISAIAPEDRANSLIIYLGVPLDIRKERLALRSDVDKVERRLAADEEDFKDFTDFDIRLDNPNY